MWLSLNKWTLQGELSRLKKMLVFHFSTLEILLVHIERAGMGRMKTNRSEGRTPSGFIP